MAAHTIHAQHRAWDPDQTPHIHLGPGDELTLAMQDASANRIQPDSDAGIIDTLEPGEANPLTGPVYVDGAEPGDLLVVDILDFACSGHGWTAIIPGLGLLADQFDRPYLHHCEYDQRSVRYTDSIVLPARPFSGTIGVSPPKQCASILPHPCGGNMDYAGLTAGARLYFPVSQPGALFSAGDGHAAQGDGEVCGTAVETRLDLRVKFDLVKGQAAPAPRAIVPQSGQPEGECLVTMGIGPDLMQACREAVSFMVDQLSGSYGLEPELAYCLCSCAGHLGIAEIVNAPNWTVYFRIPLNIFR